MIVVCCPYICAVKSGLSSELFHQPTSALYLRKMFLFWQLARRNRHDITNRNLSSFLLYIENLYIIPWKKLRMWLWNINIYTFQYVSCKRMALLFFYSFVFVATCSPLPPKKTCALFLLFFYVRVRILFVLFWLCMFTIICFGKIKKNRFFGHFWSQAGDHS